MATLEDLDDLEQEQKEEKTQDAEMKDAKEDDIIDMEILNSSTQDIKSRKRLLENDTRIMRSEYTRLNHEKTAMHEKIKDNVEKIDNNRLVWPLNHEALG